jgi:hypothetical protein
VLGCDFEPFHTHACICSRPRQPGADGPQYAGPVGRSGQCVGSSGGRHQSERERRRWRQGSVAGCAASLTLCNPHLASFIVLLPALDDRTRLQGDRLPFQGVCLGRQQQQAR